MSGPWFSASGWRDQARSAVDDHLASVAARRTPAPPEPPPIRVRAITASWCIRGVPVTVGETYSVSPNEAHRLVHVGKAEFA